MLKNERGAALPIVFILSMALIILGASLFTVSLAQASRTVLQEKREQAFYIAKSGADAIASYIIDNYRVTTLTDTAITNLNNHYLNQDISFGDGFFRAKVSRNPSDPNVIVIESKGIIDNVSNRTTLTLGPDGPVINMTHAILSNGEIKVTGGFKVWNRGDVAAVKGIEGIGSSNLDGGDLQPRYTGEFPPEIPIPSDLDPRTTLTSPITRSANYGDYEGGGFEIRVSDGKDIHINFDKFKINGIINIRGSGTGAVHIYTNTIKSEGSFTINNLDRKVVILYAQSSIDLKGSFDLNGVLLYAPNSTLTQGEGSVSITGAMITSNLELSGGTVVHYDETIANFINAIRKFERYKWSDE
ncbi:hypothetical protein ACE3MQ_14535 [Paenibacillus lentus]|uniref:DUF7305 domain-containing protein n=1 Tax=Paenibacillus lentus TaxID=1338368 RepID=UPI003653268D